MKKQPAPKFEVFKLITFILVGILAFILILSFAKSFFMDGGADQICIPKMSGFFQSLEENHSVAVFDMTDAEQRSLASQVSQYLNRINSMKIGVNGR